MGMGRKRVDLEEAIKRFEDGYTITMEFYEPGKTTWYAAYAYSKTLKGHANELPSEITFGELANARFFVLSEQLKFEI